MTTFRERAGIEVIRLLARDAHLECLLVRIDAEQPRTAVLARALDETGARLRRRQLAALDRAEGDGVVRVLDVVDDDAAPAALLEHVRGITLGELLGQRGEWRAGEAVGVLAPLVTTVRRLHDAGIAHGRLGASEIVVAETGPVLGGFLHAEFFPAAAPEAVRERLDGVAADRTAVRELCTEVLARVEGSRARAARDLAAEAAAAPASRLLDVLVDGLGDLAAAVPLRREAPPPPSGDPGRRAERMVPIVVEQARPSASTRTGAVHDLGAAAARAIRVRLDAMPAMRRRLLVGGAAALGVAGILLTALPGEESRDPVAERVRTASAPPPDVVEAAPPTGPTSAAILGDDPLAAAVALLDRRDSCMRELSHACLETVDQAGSAALDDDRAAVDELRRGGEAAPRSVEATGAQLLERLGDSALVRIGPETAPASLLLVRGEAGWRIRDWVAAG